MQKRERPQNAQNGFRIGVDVFDITRMKRALAEHNQVYLDNVFAREEQEKVAAHPDRVHYYASRFALKEAAFKALRIAWREGMEWHQIIVREEECGAPYIIYTGKMGEAAEALGVTGGLGSVSQEGEMIFAVVSVNAWQC